MDATNEGNSFHSGVNFEEALEDEAASPQELGEEDLNNIVEESKPESTKKCTTWGLKRLFRWAKKRNKHVDLKTILLEQLNTTQRQFYAEVKPEKKGMLTPSVQSGIRDLIVITLFYLGDIDIYGPHFSFMSLQCHFCPRRCLGHKWHWRAINKKERAINIDNASKNSVIVIFLQKVNVISYSLMVFHFYEKKLPRVFHEIVTIVSIPRCEGFVLFLNCS